jgi:hypothetical protein
MIKRISISALSYLIPTFAIALVWHLVVFKGYYDELAIYRKDVIIPFGFLSISIQALLFALIYDRVFASWSGTVARALGYAAFGALLSWSFTTIAVAAKNMMSSVPGFVLIESGFTIVQWLVVGPLTVLLLRRPDPLLQATRA